MKLSRYKSYYQSRNHKRNKIKLTIFSALIIPFSLLLPDKIVSSKGNTDLNKALEDSINFSTDIISDLVKGENTSLFKGGLLYDIDKNRIVWEKKMNTPFAIASLTKMMVTLITIEDIKEGVFSWDRVIKVTKESSAIGGSKVFLRYGESFTIEELMNSSMIASGNDACYLLAQANCGSEASFVERMNERAQQLGMNNTFFSNATGMPAINNKDNYSSASDLLILAKELLKYEEILSIASRPKNYVRHGTRKYEYRNHNRLVCDFNEVDGLKTGWTNNAGYCIVATANRGNYRLISIVLGAPKALIRNDIAINMFNNYYKHLGLGIMGEQLDSSYAGGMKTFSEEATN